MGMKLVSLMDMHNMNKNGFTLIQMVLSLMIVSTLFVLSISNFSMPSQEYHYFISDYLYNQAYALSNYERVNYKNDYSNVEINFNERGSVNQGQSFNIDNRLIVIRPSTGNIRYE